MEEIGIVIILLTGRGAYGIVWRVIHIKSNNVYALKKIVDAFCDFTDAQRTYREVAILQVMKHENIVRLYKTFKAENNKDLYLLFEYVSSDLHKVIYNQALQDIHIQAIVYQILKALKYIHSAQLVHRDIKPSNVLINADVSIRLADFGLARSLLNQTTVESKRRLTDYVATRWYRPPEILYGSPIYEQGVDIWSVGCLLGELYHRKPLFQGVDNLNQLQLLFQALEAHTVDAIYSGADQFSRNFIQSVLILNQGAPPISQSNILQQLKNIMPTDAYNLMLSMLAVNPRKRISATTALEHPFLKLFHVPDQEPVWTKPLNIFGATDRHAGIDFYRKMLYTQMQRSSSQRVYSTVSPNNDGIAQSSPYFSTQDAKRDDHLLVQNRWTTEGNNQNIYQVRKHEFNNSKAQLGSRSQFLQSLQRKPVTMLESQTVDAANDVNAQSSVATPSVSQTYLKSRIPIYKKSTLLHSRLIDKDNQSMEVLNDADRKNTKQAPHRKLISYRSHLLALNTNTSVTSSMPKLEVSKSYQTKVSNNMSFNKGNSNIKLKDDPVSRSLIQKDVSKKLICRPQNPRPLDTDKCESLPPYQGQCDEAMMAYGLEGDSSDHVNKVPIHDTSDLSTQPSLEKSGDKISLTLPALDRSTLRVKPSSFLRSQPDPVAKKQTNNQSSDITSQKQQQQQKILQGLRLDKSNHNKKSTLDNNRQPISWQVRVQQQKHSEKKVRVK